MFDMWLLHHAPYWTRRGFGWLVFATRFQRTSGTLKFQKTASANDCVNVLDKCGFVFTVASFQDSPVFRRG